MEAVEDDLSILKNPVEVPLEGYSAAVYDTRAGTASVYPSLNQSEEKKKKH